MKIRRLISGLLAVAAMLVLGSCVKNEFTLDFAFSSDVWGNYTVTYYASNSKTGMWMESTVPLHEGKYTLHGITRYPTVIYISRGRGDDVVLYAEHGDRLVLGGSNSDPLEWTLEKGNKTSQRLCDWRLANVGTLRIGIPDSINAAVRREVLANPDEPASAIILMTYYDRRFDDRGFAYLWNALRKGADRDGIAKLCGCVDLVGNGVYTSLSDGNLRRSGSGALLRSVVVPVAGGRRQQLATTGKGASIFYFGRTGLWGRDKDIDTLRSLSRQWSDSASRLIVSVSMDADSTTWLSTIRGDSLRRAVNAWMPLGQADERLRLLGIGGAGWWHVTDSTGRATYSGRDAAAASGAFRSLMRRAGRDTHTRTTVSNQKLR